MVYPAVAGFEVNNVAEFALDPVFDDGDLAVRKLGIASFRRYALRGPDVSASVDDRKVVLHCFVAGGLLELCPLLNFFGERLVTLPAGVVGLADEWSS